MKALLRWQTTLSKHMQALEEPELPENFFQLSVGAPREGEKFFFRGSRPSWVFCFSYKFMSEALFFCVVSLVFVLLGLS